MSSKTPVIYLRSLRKKAGLSQTDLAKLLAVEPPTLCRYELRKSQLPTEALFACCVIFDCSPEELYPDLLNEVAKLTKQNAKKLQQRKSHKHSGASVKKDKLLTALIKRKPLIHHV